MTYPDQYAIDQTETNDAPRGPISREPAPPIVELATALHEVESQLGMARAHIAELEQRRDELLEQRRVIRTKLSDLLEMRDPETQETKTARPTF